MWQEAMATKVSEAVKEIKAFEGEGDSKGAAQKTFGVFWRRWQGKYPKAVACVKEDIESLLEFYAFPADRFNQVRTTNAMERRLVEVRRRTRPLGVFSDRTSIERILFAVLMHENRKEGVGSLFLLTQDF